MNEPAHLYEADKHRITNEAKVRTALEQPDFAEKEFEKWKVGKERDMEREAQRDLFVSAWAKVAWLAEGRMIAMGRELDKLQHRIGRQRKANREQLRALKKANGRVDELEDALRKAPQVHSYGLNGKQEQADRVLRDMLAALSGGKEGR